MQHHDVLLDALTALARARLDGHAAGVEAATAVLRWQPAHPAARREPLVRVTAAVFARDAYHCRYCGRRVVLTAVLRLLSRLDPQRLPWHPNWKATATHPDFPLLSATLDHVDPGNLCCACWGCNRRKGDLSLAELGWSLTPSVDPTWYGLSSSYPRALAGGRLATARRDRDGVYARRRPPVSRPRRDRSGRRRWQVRPGEARGSWQQRPPGAAGSIPTE